MKDALKFHQILLAVIERADEQHREATGHALPLYIIARDVGLDISTLTLVLSGECMLDIHYLLPMLVYLGCNEKEQRFIFHLAEIAQQNDNLPLDLSHPHTGEYSMTLFQLPQDTEPEAERITEKRHLL
jgi:hypothetical protein